MKTMAEVLEDHQLCAAWEDDESRIICCMCGLELPADKDDVGIDMDFLAAHQAAALAAAGYGPVKEARMAAWDEGADHAWESSGEGWNGEYPGHAFDKSANPYRAATEDAEP